MISEQFGIETNWNSIEVKAVRDWLYRCEDRFKLELLENTWMYMSFGQGTLRKMLFPVLGIKSVVVDNESDVGFRVEFDNPESYFPDVENIAKDPNAAACDVPPDYEIIAFCGSL